MGVELELGLEVVEGVGVGVVEVTVPCDAVLVEPLEMENGVVSLTTSPWTISRM